MTAHALAGDREMCLSAGMDEYLTKPIRTVDVAQLIGRLFPDPRHEHVTSHAPTPPGPEAPSNDISMSIDWGAAAGNMGGNFALLLEVAQALRDELPQLVEAVHDKAIREDNLGCSQAAHALKGSLLFLKPKDLWELAQEVEQESLQGISAETKQKIGRLRELSARLQIEIEQYLRSGSELRN